MANAHDQAVAIAARHITEQYERIAEQRKRVAELKEQGRKNEAVEARRHLADLFQWLALLLLSNRFELMRTREQVHHTGDVPA